MALQGIGVVEGEGVVLEVHGEPMAADPEGVRKGAASEVVHHAGTRDGVTVPDTDVSVYDVGGPAAEAGDVDNEVGTVERREQHHPPVETGRPVVVVDTFAGAEGVVVIVVCGVAVDQLGVERSGKELQDKENAKNRPSA
jgi:hypothetical protein